MRNAFPFRFKIPVNSRIRTFRVLTVIMSSCALDASSTQILWAFESHLRNALFRVKAMYFYSNMRNQDKVCTVFNGLHRLVVLIARR
jgi:hypothetical protein